MLQALTRALFRFYQVLMMLFVTALLSVATAAMWHFYQDARYQAQFREGSVPVAVRIEQTSRRGRDIWDAMGNFVYVGFRYHNQPYEIRYVGSIPWLSVGDKIIVLYQPRVDAFSQPPQAGTAPPPHRVSRLVDWSIIADFKPENKWLGGVILTALALFFVAGGSIVTLTGLTFIQPIARILFISALGIGALFFTVNAVQYYQYAGRLRAGGKPVPVVVVNTERRQAFRQSERTTWYRIYNYQATVRLNGQERVIAINETGYDHLKPGDSNLAVLYDTELDDCMATDYSLSFLPVGSALCFWLVFIVVIRPTPARSTIR